MAFEKMEGGYTTDKFVAISMRNIRLPKGFSRELNGHTHVEFYRDTDGDKILLGIKPMTTRTSSSSKMTFHGTNKNISISATKIINQLGLKRSKKAIRFDAEWKNGMIVVPIPPSALSTRAS